MVGLPGGVLLPLRPGGKRQERERNGATREHRRQAPDKRAFRIDDGDGSLFADTQAVRPGPIGAFVACHEARAGHSFLEMFPDFVRLLRRCALPLGSVSAEQDMTHQLANARIGRP